MVKITLHWITNLLNHFLEILKLNKVPNNTLNNKD